ncbi:MAG: molybdenum cofactor guanylyltransferase [Planctomycetota bacterium]|jgi:molybdopterin-guanine dinucleotide biosynthesis protein A
MSARRPAPCAGAILAGGASRRMGTSKHSVRLDDGRTMLERVAAALRPVCGAIVVVGPPSAAPAGVRHVEDRRPGLGPLAGVEALLASGLAEQYLVCPCDLPCVTTELLAVIASPAPSLATVLRIEGEDRPRPLPARVAAAALPDVTAALDAGRRSMRALLDAIRAQVIDVPASWAAALHNVNAPEDLRELHDAGRPASDDPDA